MHPWDLGNIFIFSFAQSMGISVRFVSVLESDKPLSLHKQTKTPWGKFWLCTILTQCLQPSTLILLYAHLPTDHLVFFLQT